MAWKGGLARRIRLAAMLCALLSATRAGPVRADYVVCDLGVAEFVRLAYAGPFSERLIKWPSPPHLMVLSRSSDADLTADVDQVRATIGRYEFWKGVEVSYARFSSSSDLLSLIASTARNTAVVIVDDRNFEAQSPADEATRQALRGLLLVDELADQLLQHARESGSKKQVGRATVSVDTGEVAASASLIRANAPQGKLQPLIFIAFMKAVSPSLDAPAMQQLLHHADPIELSPTGVGYFRILLDPRVLAGVRQPFFTPCAS